MTTPDGDGFCLLVAGSEPGVVVSRFLGGDPLFSPAACPFAGTPFFLPFFWVFLCGSVRSAGTRNCRPANALYR